SGDLDAWLNSIAEQDARKPEIGAEIALRLAGAGRAAEARTALEASRSGTPPARRWGRPAEPEPPTDAWLAAEIAVLEAEGRRQEADEARWRRFERNLS